MVVFSYYIKAHFLHGGQHSKDICLQTLLLLFKCSKRETKELFVSPANSSLVGILITKGDVTDIFATVILVFKTVEVQYTFRPFFYSSHSAKILHF